MKKIFTIFIVFIFLFNFIPLISEVTKADNGIFGEPFIYWFAPNNSFGTQSEKFFNMSYFKKLCNKHINVTLDRSNDGTTWINANDYLVINVTWDNINNTAKITLSFTAPITAYYRLTTVIDRHAKSHLNRTIEYEYWLNYTVGNNETYNLFFNWSDLIPLIQQNKITVKQGVKTQNGKKYFYQRIKSVNKVPKNYHFILDPTFGGQNLTYSNWYDNVNSIYASESSPNSNGIADNMSLKFRQYSNNGNVTLGLYYASNDTFLASTEEKFMLVEATTKWHTFNFSTPKPHINSMYTYYLVSWGENTQCQFQYHIFGESGHPFHRDTEAYTGIFPNIYVSDSNWNDRHALIYCSYTEPPPPPFTPEINYMLPSNNLTNICPCCNILSVNIFNNNSNFNISFLSNVSGVWDYIGINFTNVEDGTYSQVFYGFVLFNTSYYWKINVSDYTNNSLYNVSNIYKFTTTSNIECNINDETYFVLAIGIGLIAFVLAIRKKTESEDTTIIIKKKTKSKKEK